MNEEKAPAPAFQKAQVEVYKKAEENSVEVKVGNEIRKLSPQEAADYAGKGFLYEELDTDITRLRNMACEKGQSIAEYLDALQTAQEEKRMQQLMEQCSGNKELAEHILKLEKGNKTDASLEELQSFFPEFDVREKIPESVRRAAEIKGTRLLDEYLRYCLKEERCRHSAEQARNAATKSSIGSQSRYTGGADPVHTEFLKALWNR